ncbi:MAG TPA: 1,3-beta-glucanase, partial [Pseudonocardiaceae bacterium]
MDRPVRSRVRIAANALVLLAGCLAAIAVAAVTAPQAHAGTAPPPPAGWTTVFSDNFAGAAGSAPASANWFYD